MKRLLLVLAACNTQPTRKLPSAAFSPSISVARTSRACGFSINYGGQPYSTYRYTYDALGRIAHATGTLAANGSTDQTDYAYDHLDHPTSAIETSAYGTSKQLETYDTLGDLIDYTIEQHSPTYNEVTRYTYADLLPSGQPATELIVENDGPAAKYLLAYDATNRLVTATLAGSSTTTYTYDDDGARTLTIDTDNGAFHGLVVYDEQSRELSETWGGTSPEAEAPRHDLRLRRRFS